MPATVSAGDTLVASIAFYGLAYQAGWPAGWTELKELGAPNLAVAWKKAAGTEGGGSITVTTTASVKAVHFCYAVQDCADPDVAPPEYAFGGTADPDALAPLRGELDYLSLAFAGGYASAGNTVYPVTGYPTGWGDGQQADATGTAGTADCAAGAASDQLTAASINPDAFTFSGANTYTRSIHVAVYPATLDTTLPYPAAAPATDSTSSNTTSQKVTCPADVAAGETLLAVIATDGSATHSWPEGWNSIFDQTDGNVSMSVAWKKAAGDEDGTQITVTSSTSQQSSSICWRIAGAIDPTVSAPLASSGATGASSAPNPDSLDAGSSDSYLWFAFCGADANKTVSGFPTGYGLQATYKAGATTGAATAAGGAYPYGAQTQDPGAFTLSGSDQWVACTVAVKPSDYATAATQEITGTVTSAATVTGTLTVEHRITAAVASAATVTGALTVEHRIAGTAASAATVTGRLAGIIRRIVGAAASSSAAAGTVVDRVRIAAPVQAASTVQGSVRAAAQVAAAVQAVSAAAGGLRSTVHIGGAATAASAVTGSVQAEHRIDAPILAVSAAGGSVRTEHRIDGTAASASTVQGEVAATVRIAGTVTAASAVQGEVGTEHAITLTISLNSTVQGSLRTTAQVAATIQTASAAAGALQHRTGLSASPQAISQAAGTIRAAAHVAAPILAVSAATGTVLRWAQWAAGTASAAARTAAGALADTAGLTAAAARTGVAALADTAATSHTVTAGQARAATTAGQAVTSTRAAASHTAAAGQARTSTRAAAARVGDHSTSPADTVTAGRT